MINTPEAAGSRVLLQGDPGTGKTHSIRTLVEAGLETFVLFTEDGRETLEDIPADKLHWSYVHGRDVSWKELQETAKQIANTTLEGLTKFQDHSRAKTEQLSRFLEVCNHPICERTGKKFPPVDEWGPDMAFVVDSLSGLSLMVKEATVGKKLVLSPGNWQVAQNTLLMLIEKFTLGLSCHFVMTSHPQMIVDEVSGMTKAMPSTLGQKIGGAISRYFSEHVTTIREGSEFWWSTAESRTVAKARSLPISKKLKPSFLPIVEKRNKYLKENKLFTETQQLEEK